MGGGNKRKKHCGLDCQSCVSSFSFLFPPAWRPDRWKIAPKGMRERGGGRGHNITQRRTRRGKKWRGVCFVCSRTFGRNGWAIILYFKRQTDVGGGRLEINFLLLLHVVFFSFFSFIFSFLLWVLFAVVFTQTNFIFISGICVCPPSLFPFFFLWNYILCMPAYRYNIYTTSYS